MYVAVFFLSVFVASVSQILLKKSALKKYDSQLKEYMNPYVIIAYGMLAVSMFMTIFAYKGVDLKTGPVIEATSYFYVAVMSAVFLKEKIKTKKKIGLIIIILGIIISNL